VAELDEALAQRQAHGLLLREAALQLLRRDVALLHENLADALAIGELQLLAENVVEGVLVDEAELDQHGAETDAGALMLFQRVIELLLVDVTLREEDLTDFALAALGLLRSVHGNKKMKSER